MPDKNKWYSDQRVWLEAFVLVNLAFLSLDIYLAHSVNQFHRAAEYIPLYFSLAAPLVLLVGLLAGEWLTFPAVWRDLGYLVGWLAVVIGLVGVVLHLDSHFFIERTLKSLVYAAPFAAPLAYRTGATSHHEPYGPVRLARMATLGRVHGPGGLRGQRPF